MLTKMQLQQHSIGMLCCCCCMLLLFLRKKFPCALYNGFDLVVIVAFVIFFMYKMNYFSLNNKK